MALGGPRPLTFHDPNSGTGLEADWRFAESEVLRGFWA